MARRLRFNGTGSGVNGCPAVHEDLDTGESDHSRTGAHRPRRHRPPAAPRATGEVPIVVPRELLVDFGPKEVDTRAEHHRPGRVRPAVHPVPAHGVEAGDPAPVRVSTKSPTPTRSSSGASPSTGRAGTPQVVRRAPRTDRPRQAVRARPRRRQPRRPRGSSTCSTTPGGTAPWVRTSGRSGGAEAERLQLPDEDFWIFDSRLVARLNFDDADNLVDVELITEPVEVNRYCPGRATPRGTTPCRTRTFAASLAATE
jgi:hypothetical protein